ncbi:MAG: aspartate kinase [Candidatus Bathycorpusculaceae bacterium]
MSENQNDAFGCFMVVKFGGSSLANGEKISGAVKALLKELRKGTKIVVVVSALGKTTDFLLDIAREATNCSNIASNSDVDDVLAMGERTSARIFSAALKANGAKCRYFDPADPDWPIITNDMPMNADPILQECEERVIKHVLPLLKEDIIVVVPGFIGKTLDGKITTMGRGGSDITALVLARALRARQVIIVTDVDGIMTVDPKLVKNAKKIPEIDVNSLIGLASCGKKFLQRKALKYKDANVDIKIVNHSHCDLSAEGTIIKGSITSNIVNLEFPRPVSSITVVGKALSQSPEVLHHIFQKIRNANVSILGISANYDSLILYVPEKMVDRILEQLHSVVLENPEALAIAVRKNLALLKIKTAGLEETPGIISRCAQTLQAKNINIYGLFTIASGIHVFVDMTSVEEALIAVKESVGNDFEVIDSLESFVKRR